MAGLRTITQFEAKVDFAKSSLENGSVMKQSVEEHATDIIQANKDQLYLMGQNPLGISLGDYSPYTVRVKREKGQPYDRVTLRDTGEFYAGFRLDADSAGFSITSTDWKTEELLRVWGPVFGLNQENRQRIAQTLILPDLRKFTRETLFSS